MVGAIGRHSARRRGSEDLLCADDMYASGKEKIDALEKLLRQYGVKELVRTGKIAMLRGIKTVKSSK